MARTQQDIYKQIVNEYQSQCATVGITVTPVNWGLLNRRRIWANAQALAIWLLEAFFIEYKSNVEDTIARMKPGTGRWLVEMAKKFQYGHALLPESDQYDNTGFTEAQINESKIIAFAALVEEPRIRLKVATLNNGVLEKVPAVKMPAFKAYIKDISYAGIRLYEPQITSDDGDLLKTDITLIYNPQVLDNTGARRDGTDNEPVKKAIRNYLQNIEFNGTFDKQKYEAEILDVDGITSLNVNALLSRYGNLAFTPVGIRFIPDSGYLKMLDADFTTTYIPQ